MLTFLLGNPSNVFSLNVETSFSMTAVSMRFAHCGSFLGILLNKVVMVTAIQSEAGFCVDMGSFLLSLVMVGREIQSEVGSC